MSNFIIPNNYKSELNLYETQIAIKTVKDFFQTLLAERLHLLRVSAPLFVAPESGLNDNLNGVERPVTFDIKCQDEREAEIPVSQCLCQDYAVDAAPPRLPCLPPEADLRFARSEGELPQGRVRHHQQSRHHAGRRAH